MGRIIIPLIVAPPSVFLKVFIWALAPILPMLATIISLMNTAALED